ncbi:hypothetical protein TNCV_3078851, partial [Trichonephila clavipes]
VSDEKMAFGKVRKEDLRMLATEFGLAPSDNPKIIELKDLLTNCDRYDEEFVKKIAQRHCGRTYCNRKTKSCRTGEETKAVVVVQQREENSNWKK